MLETYGPNVTYNPEFLRAKTAEEDFANQKHFILGGTQIVSFCEANLFILRYRIH